MNNTFNLNRFGLLLRRQWQEFGKIYLTSLLVITGVIIIFYAFQLSDAKDLGRQYQLYDPFAFRDPLLITLGFLFISIISSTYFSVMGQKSRAIVELMVPGSVLEKFISGVLFTAILSVFSFLTVVYIVDMGYVSYLNGLDLKRADPFSNYFSLQTGEHVKVFYVLPFLVSSVFLLGSIYFDRFHYIKTAVTVMIFGSFISWVTYQVGKLLFSGKVRIADKESGLSQLSSEQVLWIMVTIMSLLTLTFWIIGYIRLKEKEV